MSSNQGIERQLPPRMKFNPDGVEKLVKTKMSWDDWFASKTGRQVMMSISLAAASLASMSASLMTTILPGFTQDAYTEMQADAPDYSLADRLEKMELDGYVPPPRELVRLYATLWQRAGLDEYEHDKLTVFTSTLMDPVVVGTSHCRDGGSVGLPRHMLWKNEEEVDLESVTFKPYWNKFFKGFKIPQDADPEDIKELKESLLLSPEARQFIVSKCMAKANDYYFFFTIFLPLIMGSMHYVVGRRLNANLELFNKTKIKNIRFFRLGIQSLWGFVAVGMTIMLHNVFTRERDSGAVETVINSIQDAEAAAEFYNKCIRRNKVLRKIIGPESHYYIEEDGNIVVENWEFPEYTSLHKSVELAEYIKDKLEKQEASTKRGDTL